MKEKTCPMLYNITQLKKFRIRNCLLFYSSGLIPDENFQSAHKKEEKKSRNKHKLELC